MSESNCHPNCEKVISPVWGMLLLAGIFLLLYEPWTLGIKDFWRLEGFYTAVAQELHSSMSLCSAHGIAFLNAFPLYPKLGSMLAEMTGMQTLTALRLLAAGMTFLTGLLIILSVWRARNFTAAAAAASIFWGSNIVIEKSWDAYPTSSAVLALTGAQLAWFYIGATRGSWNWAWITSMAILSLAFLAGGFQVLVLFIFPMIFLRRPLTLWPKMTKPGLLIGLALLATVIFLWLVPYRFTGKIMPIQYWEPDWRLVPYLKNLLQFPWDFLIRFSPWILILWAPFCVTQQALDPTPVFSRYLRTVAIATFFLLWLSPETESHDLMFPAAPLAMLGGMYYEGIVRRFAPRLRWIAVHAGNLFVLVIAALMLLFCILPEKLLHFYFSLHQSIEYRHDTAFRIICLGTVLALFAAAAYIRMGSARKPLWITMMFPVIAAALFYHIIMFPYRTQEQEHRNMAVILAKVLAEDRGKAAAPVDVYKYNISDLYGECSFMNARIRKITSMDELPIGTDTVYLLSTEFPQQPDWDWINLLPPDQTYRGLRICLWKGKLHKEESSLEARP